MIFHQDKLFKNTIAMFVPVRLVQWMATGGRVGCKSFVMMYPSFNMDTNALNCEILLVC